MRHSRPWPPCDVKKRRSFCSPPWRLCRSSSASAACLQGVCHCDRVPLPADASANARPLASRACLCCMAKHWRMFNPVVSLAATIALTATLLRYCRDPHRRHLHAGSRGVAPTGCCRSCWPTRWSLFPSSLSCLWSSPPYPSSWWGSPQTAPTSSTST
jgi:hypothetical protein